MVVPAHDKRDYAFAKKYGLEIMEVIKGGDISKGAYIEEGVLINSGQFNGLESEEAIDKITAYLEKNKLGRKAVNYHLHDWVFSRQHYWGEPIPIIHCQKCGSVSVPEKDLPVELPYVEKYKPTDTGESPLAAVKEWVKTKCPKCSGLAQRETDTMPNWAGSSWYFLRYCDPHNDLFFADFKKLKYWTPVDLYNGGMEHTTLHLLYSRFWHKFLYDIGLVPTSEPYLKRRSHGMILGGDSRKMSKSSGNIISPDKVVEDYGADSLRLYEMFMGPYSETMGWSTEGLEGCHRFLKKVWSLFEDENKMGEKTTKGLIQKFHYLIKKVSDDLENMKFNTAVAAMMGFVNFWQEKENVLSKKDAGDFLKILAPFVPHFAEELWHNIQAGLSENKSIFQEKWPNYDPSLVKEEEIQFVVQINGRIRDTIKVSVDISEAEAKEIAQKSEKIKKYLSGKEIKKIIFVPGKLINFVV